MYWNAGECREEWAGISINRNMRCIEIVARRLLARPYDRLIETWDVLKLILCPQFCCQNMINRNMRCIEISVLCRPRPDWDAVKGHIRCIEISVLCRQAAGSGRINRNMRCIEIALLLLQQCLPMLINRNMRCIEIGNRRHSGGHYRD